MLVLTTNLGLKAIVRKKFFSKSIIFGFHRIVSDQANVVPLRLMIDFSNSKSEILVGRKTISLGHYLENVLSEPEKHSRYL